LPFQEIVGQDRVIQILKRALERDNLPHAYLYYGADGVGKFKVALSLAKALLCEKAERDFCGACPVCRQIESGNHADVLVLRPESRKGEKDWFVDPAMGTIRIEQIRQLQHWIAVGSFQGGWRLGILEGADKLNAHAANSLLKTLEEPPPRSLLILISPTRTQLIPTIVSRCQPVYFPPIARAELEAALTGRLEASADAVTVLARLADGSIGKALALDRDWVFQERGQWIARLCAFLDAGGGPFQDFVDELIHFPRMMEVLELYQTWFRDLLVYLEMGEAGRLLNADLLKQVEQFSTRGDSLAWIGSIAALQRAREAIQNHFNSQLVVEGMLLDLVAHRDRQAPASIWREES